MNVWQTDIFIVHVLQTTISRFLNSCISNGHYIFHLQIDLFMFHNLHVMQTNIFISHVLLKYFHVFKILVLHKYSCFASKLKSIFLMKT